ncbi:hypothetical protein LUCX_25 [Xanthomonas phage vB_XciM_LucasX]|nr:hypothetical protein LUCX_25 [Xanthomonas phage vB_XciM_LucasX]
MSDLYSTWNFGTAYFKIPILVDVGEVAGKLRKAGKSANDVAEYFRQMEGVIELEHPAPHAERLYGW